MPQPHLKIDEIDKHVILLSGDPEMEVTVLKHLEQVRHISDNKGYKTFRGKYNGVGVSVVSTGIGCPSAAIAIEELAYLKPEIIIRVGTCGGLLREMDSGSIVIPKGALCYDGTTKEYDSKVTNTEASVDVFSSLSENAQQLGVKYFTGINRTHDAFYEPMENFTKLSGKELVSSEMECSAVFYVSRLRNIKAGAVLIVNTPEPPEDVAKDPSILYKLVDENKVNLGRENAVKIALDTLQHFGSL
jgi:uridine phosphorylase